MGRFAAANFWVKRICQPKKTTLRSVTAHPLAGRRDTQPICYANHHPPPSGANHAGVATPTGNQTSAGTPSATANESEAHDPEPEPQKARRDGADNNAGGQADAGNETQQPPADATARTQATERAANEPRPTPNADARNTTADGTRERTSASTPEQHPTTTVAFGDTRDSAARTAAAGTSEREPENPTH